MTIAAATNKVCFGREEHLAAVSEAFERARRGAGCLVGISGPSGMGKSTFLAHIAARLEGEGAWILRLNCRAGGANGALVNLLRQLWQRLEQLARIDATASPALADIERLLEIVRRPRLVGSAAREIADRSQLFDRVAEMLRIVGERRPLAVVFSDADAADRGTHELIAYLARVLAGLYQLGMPSFHGLLVVSASSLDLLSVPEWLRGVELLPIALDGLGREALRDYLASSQVVERVMRLTKGVPQQVDELLRGQYSYDTPALVDRIDQPVEKELLSVLAALGRPASVEWLVRLLDLPDLTKAVTSLTQRGLLEKELHDGQLRIAFKRIGDERAVCEALSLDEQRRIHGLLASALDAQYGFSLAGIEGPQEPCAGGPRVETSFPIEALDQYAEHMLIAGLGDDAVRAALVAGEQLEIMFCYERAANLYERALPLASATIKARLLRALVDVHQRVGQLERAIELASQLSQLEDEPDGLLRRAKLHLLKGDLATANALLDEQSLQDDSSTAIRAMATRAEIQCLQGDLFSARECAAAGLRACCADGHWPDPNMVIELRNTSARIEMELGDDARARQLVESNLQLARQAGLAAEEARAAIQLGLLAQNGEQPSSAAQHYDMARELALRLDDQRMLGACYQHLGVCAERTGDLGAALAYYQQAVACWKKVGHRSYLAWVGIDIGKLYLRLGDTARATAMLQLSEQLAEAQPPLAARINTELLRGLLCQRHLRFREAQQHFEAAHEWAQKGTQHDRRHRVELALAQLKLAREGIASAQPELTRLSATASSRVRLSALLELARATPLETAWPAAVAALELAERLGDRDKTWRACLRLGLLLEQKNQPTAARDVFDRASAIEKQVRATVPTEFLRHALEEPDRQLLEQRNGGGACNASPLRSPRTTALEPANTPATERDERAGCPSPPGPNGDAAPTVAVDRFGSNLDDKTLAAMRFAGQHPRIQQVLKQVARVAPAEATILVRGESGTGKELVADALHGLSNRAGRALVKVNCGALVESLLLSELFGHERGAFTGATQRRAGRFELADGGTIFLDEIGDISPQTQVALLRVLQQRCFERVGGTKTLTVDVRIICATNRDLEQMVQQGSFREDLYYRLKTVQIDLPPLRERLSDLGLVATTLLRRIAGERNEAEKRLDTSALDILSAYHWPGNVRELDNVLRSASLFTDARDLTADDFSDIPELRAQLRPSSPYGSPTAGVSTTEGSGNLRRTRSNPYEVLRSSSLSLKDYKKHVEVVCIKQALDEADGNITKAAELLGMKRPRLSQLVREHGLTGVGR